MDSMTTMKMIQRQQTMMMIVIDQSVAHNLEQISKLTKYFHTTTNTQNNTKHIQNEPEREESHRASTRRPIRLWRLQHTRPPDSSA